MKVYLGIPGGIHFSGKKGGGEALKVNLHLVVYFCLLAIFPTFSKCLPCARHWREEADHNHGTQICWNPGSQALRDLGDHLAHFTPHMKNLRFKSNSLPGIIGVKNSVSRCSDHLCGRCPRTSLANELWEASQLESNILYCSTASCLLPPSP